MIDAKLIEVLFPALAAVRVVAVVEDGGVVCVDAQAKTHSGNCPACGNPADRVHDRYVRRIADLAVGGRSVVVRLLVRRFLCMIVACARRTFVEQVPGLTIRYGRISVLEQSSIPVDEKS